MTPIPRGALWLLSALLLVVGVVTYTQKQQEIGALNLLLAQSDSVHAVKLRVAQDSVKLFVGARVEADSMHRLARLEVRRDAISERRTDSTLAASVQERDRAYQVAADTAATADTLRSTIRGLLSAAQRDSAAFAHERLQHAQTVASLTRALTADSTALQRGVAAVNAMTERALSSERQVALLKNARPSTAGKVMRAIAWGAVGFGVGRLMR